MHVADYVKYAEDNMKLMELFLALVMINEEEDGDETNVDAFNDDRAIDTFHSRNDHRLKGNNVPFEDAETTTVSESKNANEYHQNIDDIFIIQRKTAAIQRNSNAGLFNTNGVRTVNQRRTEMREDKKYIPTSEGNSHQKEIFPPPKHTREK